jgi:hypothetical protein
LSSISCCNGSHFALLRRQRSADSVENSFLSDPHVDLFFSRKTFENISKSLEYCKNVQILVCMDKRKMFVKPQLCREAVIVGLRHPAFHAVLNLSGFAIWTPSNVVAGKQRFDSPSAPSVFSGEAVGLSSALGCIHNGSQSSVVQGRAPHT